MSGGGSSTKRIVRRVHALVLHQLADDQVLVAVLAGDREHASREVLQRRRRQVLAHHDGRSVAVAEVRDLDLDALLAQLHRQRRDHERRVEPAALHRLDDRRKVGEALRLEARGAAGLRRVVGDRARQMAGDGQEPDGERLARPMPSRRTAPSPPAATAAAAARRGARRRRGRRRPSGRAAKTLGSCRFSSGRSRLRQLGRSRPPVSTSDSSPSTVRIRCTARTTSGCVGIPRPRHRRARLRRARAPAAPTAPARDPRAAPLPRYRGSRGRPCAAARAGSAPAPAAS